MPECINTRCIASGLFVVQLAVPPPDALMRSVNYLFDSGDQIAVVCYVIQWNDYGRCTVVRVETKRAFQPCCQDERRAGDGN